jgi:hypothetical protein
LVKAASLDNETSSLITGDGGYQLGNLFDNDCGTACINRYHMIKYEYELPTEYILSVEYMFVCVWDCGSQFSNVDE